MNGQATVEPTRMARLKAFAFQGADVEAHTPSAHKESTDRTYFGSAEIKPRVTSTTLTLRMSGG